MLPAFLAPSPQALRIRRQTCFLALAFALPFLAMGCGGPEEELAARPRPPSEDPRKHSVTLDFCEGNEGLCRPARPLPPLLGITATQVNIDDENEGTCKKGEVCRRVLPAGEQSDPAEPAADVPDKTEATQPPAPAKEHHPHPAAPVAKPRVQPVPGSSLSSSILTAPQRN